jgi:DNA-binding NarL/FixJ family response regulator
VLRAKGLTSAEIRLLAAMVGTWLSDRGATRVDVASALGQRESTVRPQTTRIRAKLGIERRRGVEPLVAWLARHELLTSDTMIAAIVALAGD